MFWISKKNRKIKELEARLLILENPYQFKIGDKVKKCFGLNVSCVGTIEQSTFEGEIVDRKRNIYSYNGTNYLSNHYKVYSSAGKKTINFIERDIFLL